MSSAPWIRQEAQLPSQRNAPLPLSVRKSTCRKFTTTTIDSGSNTAGVIFLLFRSSSPPALCLFLSLKLLPLSLPSPLLPSSVLLSIRLFNTTLSIFPFSSLLSPSFLLPSFPLFSFSSPSYFLFTRPSSFPLLSLSVCLSSWLPFPHFLNAERYS